MSNKVLVFGAINIDVSITSTNEYVMGDSNPADMSFSIGGVGANIATNLAVLGNHVDMITALGDNPFYQLARETLEDAGVSLSKSLLIPSLPSNFYMSILSKENDLFLGLNDMKGVESLSEQSLLHLDIDVANYDAVVLDNNLSEETLLLLAKRYHDQLLVMDTVSLAKAVKVLTILPYLRILKCNDMEFSVLQEQGFDPIQYPNLQTIVTNHDKPITVYSSGQTHQVSVQPATHVVSTSGAGDALLSGIIHRFIQGDNILEAVRYGTNIATEVISRSNSSLKGSSL